VIGLPPQSIEVDECKMAVRLPQPLRSTLILCALTILAGAIGACATQTMFAPSLAGPRFVWLTAYYFETQDFVWLLGISALLLGFAFMPLPAVSSKPGDFIMRRPRVFLGGLAVCVFVACVVGTYLVFDGYHFSRDEFLAEFDAIIFRSGRAIAPIGTDWQPFAASLEPWFMLPIAQDVGFASAYLPVNAAFRALVGLVADPNWTSPLLAAAAMLATFGIARRLWPTRRDAAFISVLLVATSSQVLVTAMTSYAMTAHLALDMIWLWFFLRDDRVGHAAAIATGFLAAGLHQLVFHPLFALPFIVRLWLSGRRPLALVYIASYAAICLFWISYWQFVLAWQGLSPDVAEGTGSVYFVGRVLGVFADFQWAGADLVLKNILRFVAWQSPVLLPLAILAFPAIRSDSGIARELLAGLLLTLVAMFVLLPYQGIGWGYRYLHGLMGSVALLSGYGWIALSQGMTRNERGACRTMLIVCSFVALFVLLPVHAWQAHDFVLPYVRASNAIERTPADIVIVDKSRLLFAGELVRNDPFLRNRPKVLDLTSLTEADIAFLCAHHSISVFDYDQARASGIAPNDRATAFDDETRARLRASMAKKACGTSSAVRTNPDTE
jgi:hypothetical protein